MFEATRCKKNLCSCLYLCMDSQQCPVHWVELEELM